MQMNDDLRKSAEQRVKSMSNNNVNPYYKKYNNYQEKVNTLVTLEDDTNIKKVAESADEVLRTLEKQLAVLDAQSKEYAKIADSYNYIKQRADDLQDSTNDAAINAKIVKDLSKEVDKNIGKVSKEYNTVVKGFKDVNQGLVDAAESFSATMKKSSETWTQSFLNGLKDATQQGIQLMNALNLNKMVSGGKSLSDLRDIQTNTKILLGVDNSAFQALKGSITDSFKTANGLLSQSDMISYLSNISEYSFRNTSQAEAMAKSITLGTKYLGLSNQSIGKLVQNTKTLADDSYMNKQMAILSTLSDNTAVSEDLNSVAEYMNANYTSIAARYGSESADQIMKDSIAATTSVQGVLGNQAGSLFQDVLSKVTTISNAGLLDAETQKLLVATQTYDSVNGMISSGSFDVERFTKQFLEGLDSFDKVALEQAGLGSLVDTNYSFEQNRDTFGSTFSSVLSSLDGIDLMDEEAVAKAINDATDRTETQTVQEKMMADLSNVLSFLTNNWPVLLGVQQGMQALMGIMAFVNYTKQAVQLSGISALLGQINLQLANKNVGDLLTGKSTGLFGKIGTWLGSSSKIPVGLGLTGNTGAGAAMLSNGALLGGAAGIVGGAAIGLYDANKTKDWQGGAARGFFAGTGNSEASLGENAMSVAGNTGKYALIGAGIGTFFGPGVGTAIGGAIGGAVGLLAGVVGSFFSKNTEAIEENTEAYRDSQDSIVKRSALQNLLFANARDAGASSDGVSYGVGSGGSSSYPWHVSSPYGDRGDIYVGDKLVSAGFHHGIDFGIPEGTKLGAAIDGTVVESGWTSNGGGNVTSILGKNGKYYKYLHQKQTPPVNVGDEVQAGDVIGYSGTTGNSTGPHLHFQVGTGLYNNDAINPNPYITSSLFAADGKVWTRSSTGISSEVPPNTEYTSAYLSKQSVFRGTSGTKGIGGATDSSTAASTPSYATSQDVDRLITAMTELQQSQNDQKEFMRALSGKNTFVYGKE